MARNRFFGLTNRVLLLLAALLLVLSYLSMVINPAKLWLMSLAGLMFVPFLLFNIFLLIWAFVRRSKAFMIPLLAIVPAIFFMTRYVHVRGDEQPPAVLSENVLKVISWNVGRFSLHHPSAGVGGFEQCADSIFSYIREQQPDIVCLQEFKIKDARKVKQYLKKRMPGYSSEYYIFTGSNGSTGNLTLSRMPVRNRGVVKFEGGTNLAIFCDYEHAGKVFRVYNCHFESYNISFSGIARAMMSSEKDLFAETGIKMRRSISRRPKQVDKVFHDIESCPVESFVCGDFNDNPMSYTYFRMMRDRQDTFVEAGDGFGATYSRLWPMLRIDYVLCPKSCTVVTHETPKVKLSDHYPVITEIAL
jgi:endonuclease/exonuclease/phosphatase family metal-dependent hydrolase